MELKKITTKQRESVIAMLAKSQNLNDRQEKIFIKLFKNLSDSELVSEIYSCRYDLSEKESLNYYVMRFIQNVSYNEAVLEIKNK